MDHPDKIVDTVIALDVAFAALLGRVRDQLPGLALLLQADLEYGSKDQVVGRPGVNECLRKYAELLVRPPAKGY